MKTCKCCNELKSLDSFSKHKGFKDGKRSRCKSCTSLNYQERKHVSQAWGKAYRLKNKQKIADYGAQWRAANSEHLKRSKAKYFQENKTTIVDKLLKRRRENLNHRIRHSIDSRLRMALKGKTKSKTLPKLLGCTISQLRQHLESQFQPGMSWSNYGIAGWHIDHIIPISRFNLEDENQLKEACNYNNLQPLWAIDNLRKGAL